MIKRLLKMGWIVLAALLCLSLVVLPACAPAEEEEEEEEEVPVITLTAATYFTSTTLQSQMSQMMEAFLAAVTNASGGTVNFTFYPGALLGGPQLYDGAANGSVDIVMTFLPFTPGRFPPMDALAQPTGVPSAWVATHVVNDYYQKYKFGEFNDTHPLFFSGMAPLVMYTKEPVRTLADLGGKRIRTGGPHQLIITALGATPNNMGQLYVYEGIQNGTIDGCYIGPDGFASWSLGEVVKYTTFPYVGGCDPFIVTMSNKCWNSLPADLQKVFTDVSASYVDEAGKMWTNYSKADCVLGASQGVEFITLSAAEKATWQTALVNVIPAWVTTMVGKGYAQSDVEGWIDYIKQRVSSWTQKQIEAGVPFLVGYP
jgi:TRAP-type C4-dicarboxylate transport system substrate-binding protein